MKPFAKILSLGSACLLAAGALYAQAPPGPLPPPPPGTVEAAPPPPRKPELPTRKTILGAWRFNKDDSDNPRDKVHQTQSDGNRGGGGGYGGPRVGFPGGPIGGGGPYGGGGRPRPQDDENGRLGDLINPVRELQVIRRNQDDPQTEMVDDREHRHLFYTDGRKIEKQKDSSFEEISARWDGNRLITDEKAPHNGKMSRTFEVSSDGHQLLETIRITDSKGNHPITVNYVYDAIETSSLSFPPHAN